SVNVLARLAVAARRETLLMSVTACPKIYELTNVIAFPMMREGASRAIRPSQQRQYVHHPHHRRRHHPCRGSLALEKGKAARTLIGDKKST
ncbi:MAG TPA: hypothetical protein VM166_05345, partial [Gemmatimonadaceae bacterium]|nr:hypothetical protein [Gemmatimonadaceae bacterium]